MTDTELLKLAVERSGVTITFLASRLNCSRNRVYSILHGAECSASEIVSLSKALHLTPDERDGIFLSEKVTENH